VAVYLEDPVRDAVVARLSRLLGRLWGSRTPVTFVTCGFAELAAGQIGAIAFLEGLSEVPVANPSG
jgi:hypothetical protein